MACAHLSAPAWSGRYLGIGLTLNLEHANLFACRSKQESESESEEEIVERIIEKEILVDKRVEVDRGCRGDVTR